MKHIKQFIRGLWVLGPVWLGLIMLGLTVYACIKYNRMAVTAIFVSLMAALMLGKIIYEAGKNDS